MNSQSPKSFRKMAGALALLFLAGTMAHAVSVTVPGTANPWLAGMPDFFGTRMAIRA